MQRNHSAAWMWSNSAFARWTSLGSGLRYVGVVPGGSRGSNPSDIGTEPLGGPRLRELLLLCGAVSEDGEAYGKIDYEEAEAKIQFAKAVKSGGL